MNRAEQAKNTTALLNLAEVNSATNAYKPFRPSQILQSEKFVSRIMEILKEEYANPFDVNLTQEQLVNLSSGEALPDEIKWPLKYYQLGALVKRNVKSSVQSALNLTKSNFTNR